MTNAEISRIADAVIARLQEKGVIPSVPREEYVNSKDAAKIIGISLSTLYKKLNEIPHVKRGKSHVFTRRSLDAYMQSFNS